MTADRQPDERLAAYVDGAMAERERDRFVAELRVNPELRRELEDYERTVATVRRALRAPTEKVDLADRVMAELATTASGPVAVVGSNRSYRLVVSVAAAAAMLVLAVWLNSLPTDEGPRTDTVVQDSLGAARDVDPAAPGSVELSDSNPGNRVARTAASPLEKTETEEPEGIRTLLTETPNAIALSAAGENQAQTIGPAGTESPPAKVQNKSAGPADERIATGSALQPTAVGAAQDDFYLGGRRREGGDLGDSGRKSKAAGDDKLAKQQPRPRDQQSELLADGPDAGPPLAYLRVTRFFAAAPDATPERVGGRGRPAGVRPSSSPAGPATGGPSTPGPGGGQLPLERRLPSFVAEQFAEPATASRARAKTPRAPLPVQTFGGLRLQDITRQFAAPARANRDQPVESSDAESAPTPEYYWLVEGKRTDVDKLMQRLGALARAAGYRLENGELQLPQALYFGAERGADTGADSTRLVLRFRTAIRDK